MQDTPPLSNELNRTEIIAALVHYYRAEVTRSLAWRDRLDRTTNWAVGATAAFLGFGFSHPEMPHPFFLFGLTLIYTLLFVESRRYRFYDAYEYRVRVLHKKFVHDVLQGRMEGVDADWRRELANDLLRPQYKMTRLQAIGGRMAANYIYLFLVLLAGWLTKITLHPAPVETWEGFLRQAALGPISGVIVLSFQALFLIHTLVLTRLGRRPVGGRDIIYPYERSID